LLCPAPFALVILLLFLQLPFALLRHHSTWMLTELERSFSSSSSR
jgi:hypothetical protein